MNKGMVIHIREKSREKEKRARGREREREKVQRIERGVRERIDVIQVALHGHGLQHMKTENEYLCLQYNGLTAVVPTPLTNSQQICYLDHVPST